METKTNETPKPKAKKAFLAGIPSWGLALITLVIAFVFFMQVAEQYTRHGELTIGLTIVLIFYYLLLIIACFFIVKQNPRSIWYVLLICNACTIGMALSADFWTTDFWKILGGSFVLSIVAAIVGAFFGRRTTVSDNP